MSNGNTPSDPENADVGVLARFTKKIGDRLAQFLTSPREDYRTFSTLSVEQLKATLQVGDLILVEGNSRVSTAIKYLTQSTWSHVCMYIGETADRQALLEADLVNGVGTVPLTKYEGVNLRICRPVNLSDEDKNALIDFGISRLGDQYDTKNIFDLMRYLLPTPPIPLRFRRSLLEFGSGDPTKAICSTLVAQAFQSIRYPILPLVLEPEEQAYVSVQNNLSDKAKPVVSLERVKRFVFYGEPVLQRRHYSHFTPRDFDLSPYFEIVKPTVRDGFDYKAIKWAD